MQKMRLHPDLGGDESLAQRLNEAVATLCNPSRRQQYDYWLIVNSPVTASVEPKPRPKPANNQPHHKATSNRSNTADKASHRADCGIPRHSRRAAPDNQIQLPRRTQCPFCHAAYPFKRLGVTGYDESNRCAQCKGAITPIESVSLGSDDDIRKIYRHAHQTIVRLYTEWPVKTVHTATMTDLSIAGCAIHCSRALPLQAVILLDTQMLNSICQIRYQKQIETSALYSIGLEFLTLDIFAGPGSVFSATA